MIISFVVKIFGSLEIGIALVIRFPPHYLDEVPSKGFGWYRPFFHNSHYKLARASVTTNGRGTPGKNENREGEIRSP
jgi:hypothetical protein